MRVWIVRENGDVEDVEAKLIALEDGHEVYAIDCGELAVGDALLLHDPRTQMELQ